LNTQPLRDDKHCLNCGTIVPERYCTHCGQENTVPHESFGHLVKHFIADIVHFDSKTLNTLKYLLFRPGLLTTEYIKGKRASYVNPIKLYIFISFVFFLAYFSIPGTGEAIKVESSNSSESVRQTLGKDSAIFKEKNFKAGGELLDEMARYHSQANYDSVQNALPAAQKDGWWKRKTFQRNLYLSEKYGDKVIEALSEHIKHNIPKMMFLLLPLFALYLKILYDKKRWYYTDHAIFSIHMHSFTFILFLVMLIGDWLLDSDLFSNLGMIALLVYLVSALKHTYQQSWAKSVIKGLILWLGYAATLAIVLIGLLFLVLAIIL